MAAWFGGKSLVPATSFERVPRVLKNPWDPNPIKRAKSTNRDKSFERLGDQMETARNSTGFEVDVIRRVAKDDDPHPLRLSDSEDDIWAAQASTAERILNAPRFDQMVVSTAGDMAMMHTMHPLDFAAVKQTLATMPNRDPLKSSKDALQAELVRTLVANYMPQYERRVDGA